MEFKAQDVPLLFFAYLGIISPYFLGLYWFDKSEFLSLDLWQNILLCISYSFPVLYLNLLMATFIWKMAGREKLFENDFVSDMINIFIACAFQQYSVLLYCFIRFGDDSLFKFYHFRDNTWYWASGGFILISISYLLTKAIPTKFTEGYIRKFIGR